MQGLHDINQSAWLLLIALIPVIGTLVLIVLFVFPVKILRTDLDKYSLNYNIDYAIDGYYFENEDNVLQELDAKRLHDWLDKPV